jgi:peptidyl-prolyl cis-trans isomerase SurA
VKLMNTMNLVRKIIICLATFLCLAPFSALSARQALDKVVAVVNEDVISQSELDNYTRVVTADMKEHSGAAMPAKDVLQKQILNKMVLDRIQLQIAEQQGIDVDSLTVS